MLITHCKHFQYADDTSVFATGKNIHTLFTSINNDLLSKIRLSVQLPTQILHTDMLIEAESYESSLHLH